MAKPGRNDPCPCGSGKKYKKCCLTNDEAAENEQLVAEHAEREERAAAKRQELRVTSGVNFTENRRFEFRYSLAIVAPPSLLARALLPGRGRRQMPAIVALRGRAWPGDSPLSRPQPPQAVAEG